MDHGESLKNYVKYGENNTKKAFFRGIKKKEDNQLKNKRRRLTV